MGKKKKYSHLLFVGPHLILFFVFTLIPVLFGVYISFTNWNMIGKPEFVRDCIISRQF